MHDSLPQMKYVLPDLYASSPQIESIPTFHVQIFALSKKFFNSFARIFTSNKKYFYLSCTIIYLNNKIFSPFIHESLLQIKIILDSPARLFTWNETIFLRSRHDFLPN